MSILNEINLCRLNYKREKRQVELIFLILKYLSNKVDHVNKKNAVPIRVILTNRFFSTTSQHCWEDVIMQIEKLLAVLKNTHLPSDDDGKVSTALNLTEE